MAVSSSANKVTITLSLLNQKATVTGLQAATTAIEDLAEAVTQANEQIAAASSDASALVVAAQQEMATSAENAQAKMLAAADTAAAGMVDLGAQATNTANQFETAQAKIASSSKASAGEVAASTAKANTGLIGMAKSMKGIAEVGVAVLSVKAFTGYETALTRLSTMAGLTQKQLAGVNSEIMKMAPGLGQTPAALAGAMYSPVSEGFNTQASMQIAANAAKLSGLSGAPISGTGSTSYAISTMLQTLGLKPTSTNIQKVTGLIRGAVGAGDMQLSDFLGAATTGIFNTSKTYGISPADTIGALDYFTSQGVPAEQAATRMRMTLSLLTGQSTAAAKYGRALGLDVTNQSANTLSQQLTSLGLTPTKLADVVEQPGGLEKAFAMLNKSMASLPHDQQVALWSKLFGGGRSDTTAMGLAQGAASGLLAQFTSRAAAEATPASTNAAWSQYTRTPAYEWAQLRSELSKMGLEIGKDLMPPLRAFITVLNPFLKFAGSDIGSKIVLGLLAFTGLQKAISITEGLMLKFNTGIALDTAAAYRQATAEGLDATAADTAAGSQGLGAISKVAGPVAGALGAIYASYKLAGYADTHKGPISDVAGALPNVFGELGMGTSIDKQVYDWLTGKDKNKSKGTLSGLLSSVGLASGGVFNQATAIVGEGNPAHPEFVVPTDPAYRSRALSLYAALGSHLMATGGVLAAPQYGSQGAYNTWLAANPFLSLPGLSASSTAGSATGAAAIAPGASTVAGNKALGQRMAAALGWTGDNWTALLALWMQESGWSNTALNPTSGAYGIAQALPASKYPKAGQASGGSSPQAQIGWGLSYIQDRYGSPVAAEAHEQRYHWYAKGGTIPQVSPLLFDTGGVLPEGMSVVANQTGRPEPLTPGSAAPGDLIIPVTIDGKQVTKVVVHNFRTKAARL